MCIHVHECYVVLALAENMSLRSKVIITIFPYVLIYEYIPKDITRIIPELIKNVKAVRKRVTQKCNYFNYMPGVIVPDLVGGQSIYSPGGHMPPPLHSMRHLQFTRRALTRRFYPLSDLQ